MLIHPHLPSILTGLDYCRGRSFVRNHVVLRRYNRSRQLAQKFADRNLRQSLSSSSIAGGSGKREFVRYHKTMSDKPAGANEVIQHNLGSSIQFYLKLGMYGLLSMIMFAAASILFLPFIWLGANPTTVFHPFFVFYHKVLCFFVGIELEVEGSENLHKFRPCVLVLNHQSFLDSILFTGNCPPGVIISAKNALKYMPFFGWVCCLCKTVFIKRGTSAAKESVEIMIQRMKQYEVGKYFISAISLY